MEVVQRFCDWCSREIHKDTGVWIGGVVDITYTWPGEAQIRSATSDEHLCPICIHKLLQFVARNRKVKE